MKWRAGGVASKQAGELAFKAAKKKNYADTRKAYELMIDHCNDYHKVISEGKNQLAP